VADDKFFNEGSERFTKCWTDDWKMFFADVTKRTGLTLEQALLFHIVITSNVSSQALAYFVDHVKLADSAPPKEPWQE